MFPLYVMRSFISITREGGFKIIHTARNKYVLDFENLEGLPTSYTDRRLELLRTGDSLPYELYPINKIATKIEHLPAIRGKYVYTDSGEARKYTPSQFHTITVHRIVSFWTTERGNTIIELKGIPTKFEVRGYNQQTHAIIASRGLRHVLLELTNESSTTSKRIKL